MKKLLLLTYTETFNIHVGYTRIHNSVAHRDRVTDRQTDSQAACVVTQCQQ